jgi:hypothetical protein
LRSRIFRTGEMHKSVKSLRYVPHKGT